MNKLEHKLVKIINRLANEVYNITGQCPYDKYNFKMEECDNCKNTPKKCWIKFFNKKNK